MPEPVSTTYLIDKIEPRDPSAEPNPTHGEMLGAHCVIAKLAVNEKCIFGVEMPYDPGYLHRVLTTPVVSFQLDDDSAEITTQNTVYTLRKLRYGESKKINPGRVFRFIV